jgi:YD repeat-containing protein
MNRQIFRYLTVAAIAVATTFTSCQKDENDNVKVKLLETMAYPDGGYYKFEYDNQNRITKWTQHYSNGGFSDCTITYSGAELTKMTLSSDWSYEFAKDENKINVEETMRSTGYTRTIYLNSDGLLEKEVNEGEGYYYVTNNLFDNGNLVKWEHIWIDGDTERKSIRDFKYDNNKSPLYHCKTPKWFLNWNFSVMGSPNNVTEENETKTTTYEYEYDSEGFPTKRTQNDGFVTEYRYTKL